MSESTSEDRAPETNEPTPPTLPDSLDDLLAMGQQYLDQQRFTEAQRVFEKALTLEPAHAGARHNLGYALECQGMSEAAIAAYEAVLRSPTPLAQSAFNLGVLLSRTHRVHEARAAFERVLTREPTCAKAWVNLGVLHAQAGELEAARQCYAKALEVDPSCHSARLKSANLKARERQWEEALAEYSRLLEEGWNPAEVYYRRGLVLWAKGDEGGALRAYEQAIEAGSDHVAAHIQLALLYAQQERYDQATEMLQRAASLAPDNPRVQYNLGNMHARQAVEGGEIVNYGYADAAMRAYRRAIELDPQLLKARYNLACVAEKMSVQEGVTSWEQYLDAARDVPAEQEWLVKARRYLRHLKDAEAVS